jgi:hypothetical protein
MMKRYILLSIVSALCFGPPASAATDTTTEDAGYFLSWQQKGQLLNLGRIQDGSGTWYDVWICPGYTPPYNHARKHLRKAGSNLHDYIEANKYRMIKRGSKACFKWGFKSCGLNFTIRGIPKAWGRHFRRAHGRVEQRVFGWWLAYPWAFMESTVETAFRGALGAAGTAGGVAGGAAIVPAYHALNSGLAATVWNFGINTVVVPTAGVTWNTIVSPPLAMLGQKPSRSRVDGFWVTIVDSGREVGTRVLRDEDVALLAKWGLLLFTETQPYAERHAALDREIRERDERLRRAMQESHAEAQRQRSALQEEEKAHVQQVAATNALAAAWFQTDDAPAYAQNYQQDLRRYLLSRNCPPADIQRILMLLRKYHAPTAVGVPPGRVRQKTDPLRRSVEVIGDSAEDAVKDALE